VGIAARSLVVLALVGAGFALGSALAPGDTKAPDRTASSAPATPAAHVEAVSIRAPAPIAPVPALAVAARHGRKAAAHTSVPVARPTTGSGPTASVPRPQVATSRRTAPVAPTTTASPQPDSQGGSGGGSTTDPFGFHAPGQGGSSSGSGGESGSP